jgi:hypothetical protein
MATAKGRRLGALALIPLALVLYLVLRESSPPDTRLPPEIPIPENTKTLPPATADGAGSSAAIVDAGPNKESLALTEAAFPKPDDPALRDRSSRLYRRYFVYDDEYYSTVDHTRIYVSKPLAPGETRPLLLPVSKRSGIGRPLQRHQEPLVVLVQPGMPVTFFAPDLGTFPNEKTCITVKAGEQGKAMTEFTYGETSTFHRVIAHSPESRGWVVFRLEALTEEAWDRLTRKRKGQ